jgi:hypothetical protein
MERSTARETMRGLRRHIVVVVPMLVALMLSVLSDDHQVVWLDRNEGTTAWGGEDRAPTRERVFRPSGTSFPESDSEGADWMRRDGDPFSSSARLHRLGVDAQLMGRFISADRDPFSLWAEVHRLGIDAQLLRGFISEVSADSTAIAWAALVQTGSLTNGFVGEGGAGVGVTLSGAEGGSGTGAAQQGNGRPVVGFGGAPSDRGGGSGSQPASGAGPVTLTLGGVVTPAPAPDPVPEPGTLLLLGPALAGLAILARRRCCRHLSGSSGQVRYSSAAASKSGQPS